MIVALGSMAGRAAKRPVIWCVMALLLLGGCDSCMPRRASRIELYRPDAPVTARVPSPTSPVGAPAQTPGAPHLVQSPESPESRPEAAAVAALRLSLSKVRRVKTGMSYEDVQKALGEPGTLIAGTGTTNSVYRWNLAGINFMGRFESGALTRKNVVYLDSNVSSARDANAILFNQNLFDAIIPGMAYDDVQAFIGVTPQLLTSDASSVTIYKWSDNRGSSIVGRFVDNVLERKSTSIRRLAGGITGPPARPALQSPDIPHQLPITSEEPPDIAHEAETHEQEYDSEEIVIPPSLQDEAAEEPQQQRVHVAGASRRDRELSEDASPHAGRSYKPLARFPDYTRRLRGGDFEIRIHNRASTPMDVAIISREGGRDMSIAAGGKASVFVGRGIYDLYYIYADEPSTLYRGQRLPVAETLTDFVVDIFDDSCSVNFLDRNLEPSSRSRR